jgi:hypothetical protein
MVVCSGFDMGIVFLENACGAYFALATFERRRSTAAWRVYRAQ